MNFCGGYDHPLIAESYDFVVPYRERHDVQFFVGMANEIGGPVLELGCGTGRILIPIARTGIAIDGLDASPDMLRVCRKKLSEEPDEIQNRVRLQEGDMRFFSFPQRFRLITIPFRTFHHLLDVSDQLACLNCVHSHLENGGYLILDLFNPYLPYLYDKRFIELKEEEPPFQLPDGRQMMRYCRLLSRNLHKQVFDMEFLYQWTGEKKETCQYSHRFTLRYYFRYEIEHLLARAGFALETIYADYQKSPFGSQYPGELIVVARKEPGAESAP